MFTQHSHLIHSFRTQIHTAFKKLNFPNGGVMFLLVCRERTLEALNAMPALISIILFPLRNEKELKKLLPFAENSADFPSIIFCLQRK